MSGVGNEEGSHPERNDGGGVRERVTRGRPRGSHGRERRLPVKKMIHGARGGLTTSTKDVWGDKKRDWFSQTRKKM